MIHYSCYSLYFNALNGLFYLFFIIWTIIQSQQNNYEDISCQWHNFSNNSEKLKVITKTVT